MLHCSRFSLLLATVTLLAPAAAWGHVSVAGPAFAGKSAVLTFGVGHGCEGFDTNTIDVSIPPEITSLRGVTSPAFGDPTMVKDDADIITNVVWTKADSREGDDMYYQLAIRTTVPNTPFVTLFFPAHQVCIGEGGEELVTDWAALPGAELLEDGGAPPPAPALTIMPPRSPGWNKYVVPVEVKDLAIFNDALIVWDGDAAYSGNAETAALIAAEEGVTTLASIAAEDTIWVKY